MKIYGERTARKHVCGKAGYKASIKEVCVGCNQKWASIRHLLFPNVFTKQKMMVEKSKNVNKILSSGKYKGLLR
jgi:hypothetical protein